jgi:prevent-host-death family protein
MQTYTCREVKNQWGAILDAALKDPIAISKHGRTVAVLLSKEEYDNLKSLEAVETIVPPRYGANPRMRQPLDE